MGRARRPIPLRCSGTAGVCYKATERVPIPRGPERGNARVTATAADGGLLSLNGRQWLVLLMVQLSNLLFGMTMTLANLVLPQMRGTFSATQDEIAWVVTLNLVATAIATPMTGWLANRLGWRNTMFFTVLGFTAASFLCGIANSLQALIMARVAQGLFGAPIMPMGQAILLGTSRATCSPWRW